MIEAVPVMSQHEILYNFVLSSLRIDIERLFERFKNFYVLLHCRNRNQLTHQEIFVVVAHTINISLELNPLRATTSKYILNPPQMGLPPRVLERMRRLPDQNVVEMDVDQADGDDPE